MQSVINGNDYSGLRARLWVRIPGKPLGCLAGWDLVKTIIQTNVPYPADSLSGIVDSCMVLFYGRAS